MQERINLLVTKDAEHLVTVDVYGVKTRDAAFIRERIFSKVRNRHILSGSCTHML